MVASDCSLTVVSWFTCDVSAVFTRKMDDHEVVVHLVY